ncbi:retrovirus-related pol polyprotein from transposon TNT 1-94 [Tanacetum coccineum]
MATMAENVIAAGKENVEMLIDSIKNDPVKLLLEITVKDTDGVTDIRRTKMTKQERESMLYDEFDKFTSESGESIHSYYLRYAKLINDMKMIPMSMSNMQINTKFVNHLQPEWSRFVIAAKKAKDLHTSLNKAMIFLSFAYSSRYPPINNQLRISSNPRTQATIQNSQVTVQNVQGRQSQGYAGNAGKNQALGARVVNTVGNTGTKQPRVIRCYNCNGEGHIAKQCTAKKRVKDSEWFKDKMLLAQAQEA